jgi:hypothetical protein
MAVRFMPGISALSRIATAFSSAPTDAPPSASSHPTLSAHQEQYAVPALAAGDTPALATDHWLAFAAATGAGVTLYAEDRRQPTPTPVPLTTTAGAAQLLTLRALTDSWVLWTTGPTISGSWTLFARQLPAQGSGATQTLATSQSGPLTSLTGVWARGDTALLTGETATGTGELLQINLATRTSALLASAPGHFYADPAAGTGVSYWSDMTFDTLHGPRGTIEQLRQGGTPTSDSPDQNRFHPLVGSRSLGWVAVPDAQLLAAASGFTALTAESGEAMLFQLTGAVRVAGNDIGSGEAVLEPYVAAGGNLIVWRTAGGWHCYDTSSHLPLGGLGAASAVALTDTAIVWSGGAGATTLYVAPTQQ